MLTHDLTNQVSSMLDTHDGHTPTDFDIVYAMTAAAEDINGKTPGVRVFVEASTQNGYPEFYLTYGGNMCVGTLATLRPTVNGNKRRQLWVREINADELDLQLQQNQVKWHARYWLHLLRTTRDELATSNVKWGSATIREP